MLYQKSFALLAATITFVAAFPTQVAKRDFTNDVNGNIKLTFSDEKIKLGSIKIDEIIKNLAAACSEQGQCDTSSIEIKGTLVTPGITVGSNPETLTVEPSGSYPTRIRNDLIDTLSAAVKVIAECKDVTSTTGCLGTAMAYCPSKSYTVNECTVPQYWGINYQAPDLGNSAPPYIGADMTIEVDSDGFCSTFTTIGSAVAGAVSGAAGGAFTLIGLACR